MEYTKDVILEVGYDEVHSKANKERKNWTSRFWHAMGRHKVVTASVISAVVFICIDLVLVCNFFRILTVL